MSYTAPAGGAVNFDFATTSQSGTSINALVMVDGRVRVANTLNTVLATRYVTPIGDGVNTVYTITHNLASVAVIVMVYQYDSGTGKYTLYTPSSIQVVDSNSVKVTFASIPTSNQYQVVILG